MSQSIRRLARTGFIASNRVAILVLVAVSSLGAQTPRTKGIADNATSLSVSSVGAKSLPVVDSSRARDDAAPVKRPPDWVLTPLVVHGAPRGYQVLRVPLPNDFANNRPAQFVVYSAGVVPILGKLEGSVPPSFADRAVTLTVGIPSDARAGTSSVGSVQFFAPGAPTVEVPIRLEVAPTRRIEISVNEALRAARPGDRFPVTYQLINLGNAADTVALRVALPQGWKADGGDGGTVIAAGAAVSRTVHISVPRDAGRGTMTIQLIAIAHNAAVAKTETVVELVGSDGRKAPMAAGTTLHVGAAATRGPWDGTPLGATYAIDGHLTENMQISARTVTAPDPSSDAGQALARSGVLTSPTTLSLWSPSWRLNAGPVGGQLTDLTGSNIGGEGSSLFLTRPTWSATAIGVRPYTATHLGTNAFFGQLAKTFGGTRVFTSASSMHEDLGPLGDPRALDAVSAGVQVGSVLDHQATSEIAYRQYNGGAGLGASGGVSLRGKSGTFELRGSHAAGGSMAFAHGTNELSFSGSRQITSRAGVTASAWHLDDDAGDIRSLRTDGWTVGANARVAPNTMLNVGARSFAYNSAVATGAFGSADQSLFGTLNTRVSFLAATIDGTMGRRSRFTSSAAISELMDRTLTSRLGAMLSASGRVGSLSLSGAVTDNGSGLGFPAKQKEYRVQVDEVPVLHLLGTRVVLGGSAARMTSFVTPGAWLTTLRGTVGATLPLGVSIHVDAEQNPLYFASTIGKADANSWVYVGRIERSIGIPRIGRGKVVEGVVFNDANGDGRRNKGETGAAGIVLHRGSETVVTQQDGRYQFAGATTELVSIDARSLPLGLITSGRTETKGGDFALVKLAPVDVRLKVGDADSSRVSSEDLRKAIVTARDSVGRTWVARELTVGVARFDGLPPGRYVMAVDFSQATEPLQVPGPSVEFQVGSGTIVPIVLAVQPRPLRFPIARKAGADSVFRGVGSGGNDGRNPKEIPKPRMR